MAEWWPIVHLIGRVLYGGYFVYEGLNHFLNLNMFTGYAQSKGVPAPRLAVIVSGLMILLGGLSILLGFHFRWGALLIVLFLIPVTFKMHNFWAETGDMRMIDMVNFTKNLALLGAALFIMATDGATWHFQVR
ncbi:Inner membrane protein YphA [bacterium HR11]|nr:Inner membrane protein YphA [bacterium HR11]